MREKQKKQANFNYKVMNTFSKEKNLCLYYK